MLNNFLSNQAVVVNPFNVQTELPESFLFQNYSRGRSNELEQEDFFSFLAVYRKLYE